MKILIAKFFSQTEMSPMKYASLSIAAFFLSNLAPAPTLAQQTQLAPAPTVVQSQRALEVSIYGRGPGPTFDSKALSAVRSVIGTAVAEGVIDTYITYGYGREGGMSSCIQLSPFQNSEKLSQLKSNLLQIMPNSNTTSYVVSVGFACAPKPAVP
jgi:hypothetical protein